MIGLTNCLKEEFDYVLIDCPAGIEQGLNENFPCALSSVVYVPFNRSATFIIAFPDEVPVSTTASPRFVPYTTEAIKRDIVNVISKYIEIDIEQCSVEIHHEKGPCLMANIPIKEVKI